MKAPKPYEISKTMVWWINYYGRYTPSRLRPPLDHINTYLYRWAGRKYKRLRGRRRPTWRFLGGVAQREPDLFAHWSFGLRPLAG